jgi:hypothetical protein
MGVEMCDCGHTKSSHHAGECFACAGPPCNVISDEVTVETVQTSIERDRAGWAFLRDAIHNVGPVPDLVREALGLRWSPVHHPDEAL